MGKLFEQNYNGKNKNMEKQMQYVVTKNDIVLGLKKLGLRKGDIVLVHSSLSSLGKVEGGPETVIQALIEVVGKTGTIMMPYPLGNATIARVFSSMKGVIRSTHPTHAVSAMGAKADYLTKDHDEMPTACGKGTPFGKLVDLGGYILLIGVDQDRNTTLHTAEDYADLPYLSEKEFKYVDADGMEKTIVLKRFPGPHRNFIGMDRIFLAKKIMRIERIGNAMVRLIDAKKMMKVCLDELKDNPAAFLCENPNCADCMMQRGKIKEARLKKESFILSATSSH
ncbi:MAG: aminoglycoside N(3)-acetyltransferase, partial [Candidatus Ratteibacteria bacterium]